MLRAAGGLPDLRSARPLSTAEHVEPSGLEAGRTVLGRKRHILTDTPGLLARWTTTATTSRRSFPFVERLIGGCLALAARPA